MVHHLLESLSKSTQKLGIFDIVKVNEARDSGFLFEDLGGKYSIWHAR